MSGAHSEPSFSDEYVIERLQQAALKGLTATRKAQKEIFGRFDLKDINDLCANCLLEELDKHEPSENPGFFEYIVVLKMELEDEPRPFYVKVALKLPDLNGGELISFHEWGLQR